MKANESKKEFSLSTINSAIGKLNKTTLLLIIIVYIVILSILLSFVGKNISYINEPSYEHVTYNDEITPQITIVGKRTLNSDNSVSLKYNINAYITSRYVDGVAEKLSITNFRMFAITNKSLTSDEKKSNYYFTEQSGYNTPVTHTYTISNTDEEQHPSTMYVRLSYKKDGEQKIATFKEPIMLQPTSSDKSIMQQWYELNKEKTEIDASGVEKTVEAKSAVNIYGSSDSETSLGTFEIASAKKVDSETDVKKVSVRIKIKDQASKKFHIDMQTWLVTESGEYLPLIGGYNYTSQVSMFTSDVEVPTKLKVKYIAMKLVYKDQNNTTEKATYLMQDYSKIKEALSTNPDASEDSDLKAETNKTLVTIIVILGTVIIVAIVVLVIANVEKKKKNQEENQETKKNLDTDKKI